jgi:hypothetical protein
MEHQLPGGRRRINLKTAVGTFLMG